MHNYCEQYKVQTCVKNNLFEETNDWGGMISIGGTFELVVERGYIDWLACSL